MELALGEYYHLYNRSNNSEIVFKSLDGYRLFLKKYTKYFDADLETIAFCLMPTHFHFLARVKTPDDKSLKRKVGDLLSSYTKTANLVHGRHGSLFQRHTKTKHVEDDDYLITLLTYIHQNPVRAKLVKRLEDWEFSSYGDICSILENKYIRNTERPDVKSDTIANHFSSITDFSRYSNVVLESVKKQYWI